MDDAHIFEKAGKKRELKIQDLRKSCHFERRRSEKSLIPILANRFLRDSSLLSPCGTPLRFVHAKQ
jgi:hypothetical protein